MNDVEKLLENTPEAEKENFLRQLKAGQDFMREYDWAFRKLAQIEAEEKQ